MVITGCGQDNSYGGTPWKASLATLRARPLTREEEQAVLRPERGRWFYRPAVRQASPIQSAATGPTQRLRGGALLRPSALRRSQAGFGGAVPVPSPSLLPAKPRTGPRTDGGEERVGRGEGELRGSRSRRGAASGGGRPQGNEAVFRKAVPAGWPPPEDRHEGTATPRERGSPRPTSAKARRDELDQRWPRAPAPSAVSRAPASGRSAGRRTRPRRRTRVRQAGRRTRHADRPGAGQHGCRRREGTETNRPLVGLRGGSPERRDRPTAGWDAAD